MTEEGRVLLADDEDTFARATAALLTQNGFPCETVPDAEAARAKLAGGGYDLLLADINMPGNPKLELVRDVTTGENRIPVILVTGYPSLESAIGAVGLSVFAYLVKPFELADLLAAVRPAVNQHRAMRTLRDARRQFQQWTNAMSELDGAAVAVAPARGGVAVDEVVDAALARVAGCLADLSELAKRAGSHGEGHRPLVHCPRCDEYRGQLQQTIEVLKETKNAFRSKNLGDLRRHLERVVGGDTRE